MIRTSKLSLHYGPVKALQEASFEVHPGEVVGLLGPNGAGKSTCMKVLTTYLYPTSGTAEVAGHSILAEPLEVRRKIGYLPEAVPLYPDLEVRDYLRFVARARNLAGDELKRRLDWVVDITGLQPMFRRPIRQLSKGYRQRTALAQALVHDPEVVILDEPTSGLDPHQILEIRHLVQELARTKTVILSTHILQEAAASSNRLLIINRGRIVGDGTLEQLRRQAAQKTPMARAVVSLGGPRQRFEEKLQSVVEGAEVQFLQQIGRYAHFNLRADVSRPLVQEIGKLAQQEGWELAELSERPLTLEEIFLSLTEPELPPEQAQALLKSAVDGSTPGAPAGTPTPTEAAETAAADDDAQDSDTAASEQQEEAEPVSDSASTKEDEA